MRKRHKAGPQNVAWGVGRGGLVSHVVEKLAKPQTWGWRFASLPGSTNAVFEEARRSHR